MYQENRPAMDIRNNFIGGSSPKEVDRVLVIDSIAVRVVTSNMNLYDITDRLRRFLDETLGASPAEPSTGTESIKAAQPPRLWSLNDATVSTERLIALLREQLERLYAI